MTEPNQHIPFQTSTKQPSGASTAQFPTLSDFPPLPRRPSTTDASGPDEHDEDLARALDESLRFAQAADPYNPQTSAPVGDAALARALVESKELVVQQQQRMLAEFERARARANEQQQQNRRTRSDRDATGASRVARRRRTSRALNAAEVLGFHTGRLDTDGHIRAGKAAETVEYGGHNALEYGDSRVRRSMQAGTGRSGGGRCSDAAGGGVGRGRNAMTGWHKVRNGREKGRTDESAGTGRGRERGIGAAVIQSGQSDTQAFPGRSGEAGAIQSSESIATAFMRMRQQETDAPTTAGFMGRAIQSENRVSLLEAGPSVVVDAESVGRARSGPDGMWEVANVRRAIEHFQARGLECLAIVPYALLEAASEETRAQVRELQRYLAEVHKNGPCKACTLWVQPTQAHSRLDMLQHAISVGESNNVVIVTNSSFEEELAALTNHEVVASCVEFLVNSRVRFDFHGDVFVPS